MTQLVPDADLVSTLEGVAQAGADLLGYDVVTASLATDGSVLETVASTGEAAATSRLLGSRIPVAILEHDLAGAAETGGLRHLPHHRPPGVLAGDDRGAGAPSVDPNATSGDCRRSGLLVLPVRDDSGQLRAVLHFIDPREGRRFDPGREDRLRRFCERTRHRVLAALERAHLAERLRLADAARTVVRRATSELSVDKIIEVSQPALATGFGAVGLWMHVRDDGSSTDVVYGATEGPIEVPEELKELSQMAAVQLWRDQQVAVVTDRIEPRIEGLQRPQERQVHDFLATILEARSMLFVPLGAGRQCLGSLALTRRGDSFRWSEPEQHAALEIGHDLGRALVNARTFERERRLIEELSEISSYRTRLISTIAHELKNPLTAIVGHAELLSTVQHTSAPLGRAVPALHRASARMQDIIDRQLRLAEAGEHAPRSHLCVLDQVAPEDRDLADRLRHHEGRDDATGPVAGESRRTH